MIMDWNDQGMLCGGVWKWWRKTEGNGQKQGGSGKGTFVHTVYQ